MDFEQVEKKFKQLKAEFDAGKLPEAEFKFQLEDLMIQDKQGSWWMIGYETGLWYRNDGKEWVQTDPPDRSPKKSTSVVPAAPKPKAQKQIPSVSKKLGSPQVRMFGFIGIIVFFAVAIFLFRPKNQETASLTEKAMSIATASTLAVQQPSVVKPTSTSASTTTPRPTWTPKPTRTPNLAATKEYKDFFSKIQDYTQKGYISSLDGDYVLLDSYSRDFAMVDYYEYPTIANDQVAKDFVFNAHFQWSTALENSTESGCGVVFGIRDNVDGFQIFLDKSRIWLQDSNGEIGKTRGTGRVSFGNPADADFSMIVDNRLVYVFVNDNFIGEYTLSQDANTEGKIGYTVLSGTNKDYGTHCEIADAHLWVISP